MKILSTIIFLSVAILIVSAAPQPLFAQHEGHDMGRMGAPPDEPIPMPFIKTGSIKSRIVEIAEQSIVVEGKYEGKIQRVTLMTDNRTKKNGKIEVGSAVTVKYEEKGGILFATALKGPKSR